MKSQFPKLQGLLGKENEKNTIISQYAFVYKGHILFFSHTISIGINLRDYLKVFMDDEEEDDIEMLNDLMKNLEGKVLSKEFFNVFSKTVEITDVEKDEITIVKNGMKSTHFVNKPYAFTSIEEYLKRFRILYNSTRSTNELIAIKGDIYKTISSVFSNELTHDSIVLDRSTDDICRFSIVKHPFIFGVFNYDVDAETSIFNFSEGRSFFDL